MILSNRLFSQLGLNFLKSYAKLHIHHDSFFNILCTTIEWISSEQTVRTLCIYSEDAQFPRKDLPSQAS